MNIEIKHGDIIKLLTTCFNMRQTEIANKIEKCDYFADSALISKIKNNKSKFTMDSEILYKALFENLLKEKKMDEGIALDLIRKFLIDNGLMSPILEKYNDKGFNDFIHILLKFTLGKQDEKLKTENPYNIVGEEEIRSWGWTPEQQVGACMALDYESMENLTCEHEGTSSQWIDIIRQHGETWKILMDNEKKVIGYWQFIPLFKEDYTKMVNGNLLESEINSEQIPPLFPNCDYDIFFSSLCLQKEYQGKKIVLKLLESIRDVVIHLEKQQIFFRNICTLAYTGSGKAICKHLGFKLNKQLEYGDIYTFDMLSLLEKTPFLNRNDEMETIIQIYSNHFKNKE